MSVGQLKPLNFIGGKWQSGHNAKTLEVFNPATAEVLAVYTEAGQTDVDEAVQAAAKAFPDCSRRCSKSTVTKSPGLRLGKMGRPLLRLGPSYSVE
jgi:hypothetical protein